jgi:hypothetical protein
MPYDLPFMPRYGHHRDALSEVGDAECADDPEREQCLPSKYLSRKNLRREGMT